MEPGEFPADATERLPAANGCFLRIERAEYVCQESAMGITRHPLLVGGKGLQGIGPDEALIERLQRSFDRATSGPISFADRFHARLAAQHPDLAAMFPANLEHQKQALTATLRLVVDNLRTPEAIAPVLRTIGVVHVRAGVRPEHYPPVVQVMVDALAEACGDTWSSELESDWLVCMQIIGRLMQEGGVGAGTP